jgi:hypothetical protein
MCEIDPLNRADREKQRLTHKRWKTGLLITAILILVPLVFNGLKNLSIKQRLSSDRPVKESEWEYCFSDDNGNGSAVAVYLSKGSRVKDKFDDYQIWSRTIDKKENKEQIVLMSVDCSNKTFKIRIADEASSILDPDSPWNIVDLDDKVTNEYFNKLKLCD